MAERLPPGIGLAAASALLFGLATPAAHQLLATSSPLMLSALLYLGSGLGLAMLWLPTARAAPWAALERAEWLPLAAAILLGGVLAPVALLAGLQQIGATRASLLLNLEGVFTALLAWRLFREAADGGLMVGMGCVGVAALLLAWPDGGEALPAALAGLRLPGGWLVALACLCWGLDNNLTRSVAHLDARGIAMCKGLAAGSFNLLMAHVYGAGWPPTPALLAALLTGFLGYGLSLVAYVRAQSLLGSARTAAWFGLAPFIGALASLLVLREPAPRFLWPAAALMATGLALHLRERHSHWHEHAPQQHSHAHRHDAHHQHAHEFAWDGREPHAHPHRHAPLRHAHAHYPDLHHRHAHGPDAALLAAYQAAAYRIDGAPGFTLRIGEHSPELAALLVRTGSRCAAWLTACNPGSRPLGDADNQARAQALRAAIEALGLPCVSALGEADDGSWPAEPGLLVPGLPRAQALALGRRWEQHAIVWCDQDAVPRLLRCVEH